MSSSDDQRKVGPFEVLVYKGQGYGFSQQSLLTAPHVDEFYIALRTSKLRALPAMVVFAFGDIGICKNVSEGRCEKRDFKWQSKKPVVIYPVSTRRVPVPRPIILVPSEATRKEIFAMLVEHAPRIQAYVRLFEETKLPEVLDLAETLSLLVSAENLTEIEKSAAAQTQDSATGDPDSSKTSLQLKGMASDIKELRAMLESASGAKTAEAMLQTKLELIAQGLKEAEGVLEASCDTESCKAQVFRTLRNVLKRMN